MPIRPPPRSPSVSLVRLLLACASAGVVASAVPGVAAARPAPAAAQDTVSLQLARAARVAGNLPAAIEIYRPLAATSADAALRVEYGDALLQAGRIDDAIGAYQAVDPASPAGADACLGLQRAYARLGEAGKALESAQRAATLAPRSARAQVGLGVALDVAGRHPEAQAAYRRALAVEPRSLAARNDLALSLAVTRQYDAAIEILKPIAESANATPQARQNLAFVYGLKGDRDRALALGRADLAPAVAEANQRFFDYVRQTAR